MNFAAFARRWNEILLAAFLAKPRKHEIQIDRPGYIQLLNIREIPMQDAGTLLNHALHKADRRAMEHEIEGNFQGGLGEWQRQTKLLSQSRAVAQPIPGPAPDYWKLADDRGAQKASRVFGQAPPEAIPNVTDHNTGIFTFKAGVPDTSSASPTPPVRKKKNTTSSCPCCGATTKHAKDCAFNAHIKSQNFQGTTRAKTQMRDELKRKWLIDNAQHRPLAATSNNKATAAGPQQRERSSKRAMTERPASISQPSAAQALASLALGAPSNTQAEQRASGKRKRAVIEVDDDDDEERGGEGDGDGSSDDEIDTTIRDERSRWGYQPPMGAQRRRHWRRNLNLNAATNSSTDEDDSGQLLFYYYEQNIRAGIRYRCRPLEWFTDTNIDFFRLDYLRSGSNVAAARRAVLPGNFFYNRLTRRPVMGDVSAPVYDFDAALEYLGEADAAEVFQREVRSLSLLFACLLVSRPTAHNNCGMTTVTNRCSLLMLTRVTLTGRFW